MPAVGEPAAEERAVEGAAVEEPPFDVGGVGPLGRDGVWAPEAVATAELAALLVVFTMWLTVEAVAPVEAETGGVEIDTAASWAELVVCVSVLAVDWLARGAALDAVRTSSAALDATVVAAASAGVPSAALAAGPGSATVLAARVAPSAALVVVAATALAVVLAPSAALATPKPSAWPANVSAPTLQRSTAPVRRAKRAKCCKRSSTIASFGGSPHLAKHALSSPKVPKIVDYYG